MIALEGMNGVSVRLSQSIAYDDYECSGAKRHIPTHWMTRMNNEPLRCFICDNEICEGPDGYYIVNYLYRVREEPD